MTKKEKKPEGEKIVSRRTVLTVAGWWALWKAFDKAFDVEEHLRGMVYQELLPKKTISHPSHRRLDLAFDLFLSSKAETEFIPPTAWGHTPPNISLPNGAKTYGHEFEVLRSFAGVLDQAPIAWDKREGSWLAHANFSQVMLASGNSNLASREIIGTADSPIYSPKIGGAHARLAYAIGKGTGKLKRLQYGEELDRERLAIRSEGKILAQAEGLGGKQIDDYLLVTRIPGPLPETVLTVLSGLHGPGTRAAEMLFTTLSVKDLEDLASRIGLKQDTVPYFQAVFRAYRFEPVNGSDVPTAIELVTEGCPPERLEV